MRIIINLLKLILIVSIPFFFYLNPFLPWPKDLIFEAAGHGSGVLAFFDAQKAGTPAPFFWGHTSYLLGQVALMTVYKIFGVSTFTTILNTSILGFLTILVTYFFAKKFLGIFGAILSLLLFSGSLFFLMVIKTAYPFYGTIPLTVSLTIFLFLLAHQEFKKNLLFLSGITFALVGLSGGQAIPLTFLILLSFISWKAVGSEKLFPIKSYLIAVSLALFVYLGFHALFPLINHNKPFDYFYDSYRLLSERGGQVALRGGIKGSFENASRLYKAFFFDMNVPRQGHQHFLAGRAMLSPFLSPFFIVGILIALKQRKNFDKMLILWLAIVFFFYGFVADFQVRYFLVVAPAIYVISARGMIYLVEKTNKLLFFLLLIMVVIPYLLITYRDYYVFLPKQAFKFEQYDGQEEMANFIKNNYDPKETFLVMGNVWNLPPQNFVFYTWKKNYQWYFWDYRSKPVLYTPIERDVIDANASTVGEKFQVQKFNDWEREKLKTHKKIIYIFGFYNIDLTPTREWLFFQKIRPFLEPKKIILAANGLPQIGIYEVTPDLLSITGLQFSLAENNLQKFIVGAPTETKAIILTGKTERPKIFLNESTLELPVTIYPSEKMTIIFDDKNYSEKNSASFVFNPSFSGNNFAADLYRGENVTNVPSASLVIGGQNQKGELVYKLEAPQPINKLNILFFPIILNDEQKKNYLRLSYTIDEKTYKTIYELKSDGSGGWVGLWEKQERLIISPKTKVVYLKFELSSDQAQLSSSDTQTMSFEGEFNWSPKPLVIQPGENRLWFTGGGEQTELSLFFDERN